VAHSSSQQKQAPPPSINQNSLYPLGINCPLYNHKQLSLHAAATTPNPRTSPRSSPTQTNGLSPRRTDQTRAESAHAVSE
jgi:hypothetical protein